MVDDEGRIVMRLEQARAYRGISVAELARRVGGASSTASELGDGDTPLPAHLIHPSRYEVDVLHEHPSEEGRGALL